MKRIPWKHIERVFNKWWNGNIGVRDEEEMIKNQIHKLLIDHIKFPSIFDWDLFWDTFDSYLTLHSRTWSEADHIYIAKILIKGLKLEAK